LLRAISRLKAISLLRAISLFNKKFDNYKTLAVKMQGFICSDNKLAFFTKKRT